MLWRYLSTNKYFNLLATGQIYFANILQLREEDPFEASLAIDEKNLLNAWKEEPEVKYFEEITQMNYSPAARLAMTILHAQTNPDANKKTLHLDQLDKLERGSHFVSCWHSADSENDAMWKVYAGRGAGVAITTKPELLISGPIDSAWKPSIIDVEYSYDPAQCSTASIPETIEELIGRKRFVFEHEKETRAVLTVNPDFLDGEKRISDGVGIAYDLSAMLQEIIISPYASAMDMETICLLTEKFGLQDKLRTSAMRSEPTYFS